MNSILLPVSYFGPVSYFALLLKSEKIFLERFEHFPKQTYRNRCSIYSPNGVQHLVVPLRERRDKIILKDVRVSYERSWQTLHWRSLESAYRSSPFFEFYEDDLRTFFEKRFEFLLDLDVEITHTLLRLLKTEKDLTYTNAYEKITAPENRRNCLDKKMIRETACPRYRQVFESRHGFIANLSVLDLLFNSGNLAKDYLNDVNAG